MVHTTNQQTHFILVHGACHGSWCWFKLKPLLEAAGHHVSAFDLTASGTNLQVIQQVATLADYTMPLLDFIATLPLDEKVVLVGHSLGGMNIALAMEKFPQKVSVGVFLTAFMPDTDHKPSYVLDQYNEITPAEAWLDTKFLPYDADQPDSEMSMFFGPKFLSSKLYQLTSAEVSGGDLKRCLFSPNNFKCCHFSPRLRPFFLLARRVIRSFYMVELPF
ncbi:putative alpha/beta hydrolase-1 [Helianthus annuus]|nr:putative alpha/beta hydrolase-1 [Helianthus annuus]